MVVNGLGFRVRFGLYLRWKEQLCLPPFWVQKPRERREYENPRNREGEENPRMFMVRRVLQAFHVRHKLPKVDSMPPRTLG